MPTLLLHKIGIIFLLLGEKGNNLKTNNEIIQKLQHLPKPKLKLQFLAIE